MTILIKSAAGKLLKAEGKIWDQNSVTDCDCPCYSVVNCDDSPEIERVNIKGSGKWGIEWTVSHPGGSYDFGGSTDITSPAFSESGSFLLEIPPLVKSWKYASPINGNIITDNWADLSITFDNCWLYNSATGTELIYIDDDWPRFGVSASFPDSVPFGLPPRVSLIKNHSYTRYPYAAEPVEESIEFIIYTNGGPGSAVKSSKNCDYPCCESLWLGTAQAVTDNWAPSNCGTIGLGTIPSLPADFFNDYEFEYTEHTPTFTHEIKGTTD